MSDPESNTTTDAVRMIALCKLQQSASNVRHTDKRADIESLAEDIFAHGVLQNMTSSIAATASSRSALADAGPLTSPSPDTLWVFFKELNALR